MTVICYVLSRSVSERGHHLHVLSRVSQLLPSNYSIQILSLSQNNRQIKALRQLCNISDYIFCSSRAKIVVNVLGGLRRNNNIIVHDDVSFYDLLFYALFSPFVQQQKLPRIRLVFRYTFTGLKRRAYRIAFSLVQRRGISITSDCIWINQFWGWRHKPSGPGTCL